MRTKYLLLRLIARANTLSLLVVAISSLPSTTLANSTVGAWAPVRSLPFRPVHSVVLSTGNALFWPNSDDPRIWDPVADTVTDIANVTYNPFCNGHSLMADGKVLITGGRNEKQLFGMWTASLFDPSNNTWKHLPDMNDGRWYPSQVTLANGDVLTHSGLNAKGGVNSIPQVMEVATGQWRTLSGARLGGVVYPALFLVPNGKVFAATAISRYLDTSGSGQWTTVATLNVSGRDDYGSAALYDDTGKVIYTGGRRSPPVSSAEVIDLNAPTPAWSLVAPMPQARRQHNATILPDGTLLVTGGSSSGGFNTNDGPKPAINWNPADNIWTTWATEAEYRGYHSEAILLPDARVASIGGDGRNNLQVFSPPYLFKGARPAISSAPANVGYGATFFVETPNATDITDVEWVRLSAVTHTKNMNQRINKLTFIQASGGLNVTAPSDPNKCPPGHYMMFLLNATGVPSVASIIRVGNGAGLNPSTPAAPITFSATPASSTKVNLSWANTPTNESGFKIERQVLSTEYLRIAVVGPNVTTYTDKTVSSKLTYKYRVRAYNTPGHSNYKISNAVTTP